MVTYELVARSPSIYIVPIQICSKHMLTHHYSNFLKYCLMHESFKTFLVLIILIDMCLPLVHGSSRWFLLGGGSSPKNFHGVGMDIFWNNTTNLLYPFQAVTMTCESDQFSSLQHWASKWIFLPPSQASIYHMEKWTSHAVTHLVLCDTKGTA